MLKPLICRAFGHRVNRNRVWHDGQSFRTKCMKCTTALIRERDGWKPFEEDKHAHSGRGPHPNDRTDNAVSPASGREEAA